jgi:cytochrome P450
VVARDEHDRLSEAEVINMAITLFAAGYESTASQIANFVYTLLTGPADQFRLLRERPELVPGAVEELLRYVPLPKHEGILPRYAIEDVELSAGTVRAHEPVMVSRSAANRDPAVFDDPQRLDLTRTLTRSHLAFGHGAHHCVGAPLARMDLQVALGTLASRVPGLRLAVEPKGVRPRRGHYRPRRRRAGRGEQAEQPVTSSPSDRMLASAFGFQAALGVPATGGQPWLAGLGGVSAQ